MTTEDTRLISDYGLIGNLQTVALISKEGSVDYLPFHRFDSPTLFTAILDNEKGGAFRIKPVQKARIKQMYLPDTAILLTRFFSESGMAELTDYMPVKTRETICTLSRTLHCITGEMKFEVSIAPRLDYARSMPCYEQESDHIVLIRDGDGKALIRIRSEVKLRVEGNNILAQVEMQEGQYTTILLEAVPEEESSLPAIDYFREKGFKLTHDYWREWTNRSNYEGRWEEIIRRSLITLKLLTSSRYGAPIAAATFGLPEAIGGERNWDYRYTWIRDGAFTMYVLLRMGYREEARAFNDWIFTRCQELHNAAELCLMYKVDGTPLEGEHELEHLKGFRNSRPVRIGNQASEQFQMDIYGELIDTIYLFNRYDDSITFEFWQYISEIINFVCENWTAKGHGIWEVRAGKQEFLHSKLMCWVAIDRGMKIAASRSFPAPVEKWRKCRDAIYEDIYYNYWNEEKEAFVQYRGADVLDASALLIPIVRFLSPHEKRWQSTLRALEKELVTDTLVHRYRLDKGAEDGLNGEEGTFCMCSFWYIENLAKEGQVDKARLYFDKMMGYANHLGLFSEMIALNGEQLGNFPQAFTHLSLISAAMQLDYMMKGGTQ
jgi:GH15 family glucan-1,4-alpha-glucosidase